MNFDAGSERMYTCMLRRMSFFGFHIQGRFGAINLIRKWEFKFLSH